MDKTREVIAKMMKENTGYHMLDSGGAYGRNFERNKEIDFDSTPFGTLTFQLGYIDVTLNLYHWLVERLTFEDNLQKEFDTFVELPDNEDSSWFELVGMFPEYLEGLLNDDNKLKYDVDSIDIFTENTCNSENFLSQIIQYTEFEVDECIIVMLMIHGGCDVRGGYTAPKIFEAFDSHRLTDSAQARIYCEKDTEHHWETDDSCHWYLDGGSSGQQLQDYDIYDSDDFSVKAAAQCIKDEIIFIDRDGVGFCPLCGGELGICG